MGLFDFFKKNDKVKDQKPEQEEKTVTSFKVKYEYALKERASIAEFAKNKVQELEEGEERDTGCPLCEKLLELNRVYTRAVIESISERLGYSVYHRCGGGMDEEGNLLCACMWKSVVVVDKPKQG